MRFAVVMGLLVAGAAVVAAPASAASPDPCSLLAPEEIAAAQHETVKERKASEHSVKGLHYAQCIFATTDFVRSISLTVMTGRAAPAGGDAVRAYWAETFGARQRLGRKNPPRAVAGAGQEAFWTSDARAGVLYVLSGDVVVRVSVGGLSDEDERLRRSTVLAQAALRRLRSD